jgi:hypothetical protein
MYPAGRQGRLRLAPKGVARLDRPSGNVTGFAILEASLGGKWLDLLSEIAPGLKRAAIIARRSYRRQPETTYPRSITYLPLPETAVCSPTELTG